MSPESHTRTKQSLGNAGSTPAVAERRTWANWQAAEQIRGIIVEVANLLAEQGEGVRFPYTALSLTRR